jgi:hypothetical protein
MDGGRVTPDSWPVVTWHPHGRAWITSLTSDYITISLVRVYTVQRCQCHDPGLTRSDPDPSSIDLTFFGASLIGQGLSFQWLTMTIQDKHRRSPVTRLWFDEDYLLLSSQLSMYQYLCRPGSDSCESQVTRRDPTRPSWPGVRLTCTTLTLCSEHTGIPVPSEVNCIWPFNPLWAAWLKVWERELWYTEKTIANPRSRVQRSTLGWQCMELKGYHFRVYLSLTEPTG